MATTALITAEHARHLLDYDPQTGEMRWKPRPQDMFSNARGWAEAGCLGWNRAYAGKRAGCAKHVLGYRLIRIEGRLYKEHRLAWLIHHGVWPKDQIDHINGDRLDNRMCNLREATGSENQQNTRRKGVSFDTARGLWAAYITVNRKRKHLGRFPSKDAADAAYGAAKLAMHAFQPTPRDG